MDLITKICFLIAVIEILLTIGFALKISFVSHFLYGYGKLSEIQKTQIDRDAIYKDARDEHLRLALVLIAGAFLSMHHWMYGMGALIALAVIVIRNMQEDPEKKYESYRR